MHRPTELKSQSPEGVERTERGALQTGPLVIVGGCGHVGLPLGLAFARKGYHVDLVDANAELVALVNGGRMPFHEDGAPDLLAGVIQNGLLKATTSTAVLEDAAAIIVTIGTPVDEYLDPAVREFDCVLERLLAQVRPGQLVILRSTVFPGMTDRLARQLEQSGKTFDLAYCPERIVQGKSLAELAKLFCNAWRYINFAISNQFYVMAEHYGADFQRIHHALRDGYPRMESFARAGFTAGPCLLKDTMQLGAFNHGSFVLGQAAMMINEGLPHLLVQSLKRAYPLIDMTVGILGMAFKPNSDDPRASLSYKLRKVLSLECRHVLCTDPYVADPDFVPLATVLEQADLLVVGTPHDDYRGLSFRQPVIDITGTIA